MNLTIPVLRLESRLLSHPARGSTDVEGPHGELSTGLTDGLSGNDPGRLAEVHQLAGRQVATVAHGANASPRLAGEHRTNFHPFHTRVLNIVGDDFGDLLTGRDDGLAGEAVLDGLRRDPPYDPVAKSLDDLTGLDDGSYVDALDGSAVRLGDDDILRDIHQASGQVARIGRLEGRIGQTLAGSVSRDEVLQHGKPFAEVARNGRLDDLAGRLGHETAHSR